MKNNLLRLIVLYSKQTLKYFLLQLLVIQVIMAEPGSSQSMEDYQVNLQANNQKLVEVLAELEQQTDFVFAYNQEVAKDKNRITLNLSSDLKSVLKSITRQVDYDFKRVNENIYVVKSELAFTSVKSHDTNDDEESWLDIEITGTVTDQNGDPIPGATISIPGTSVGTVTDLDGNYSLNVPDGATVVVSFIGYLSQRIIVANQTKINVTLKEDISNLEEVIVVGYGVQKKSDLTGSVVRADIEAFRESPNVSIMQSLQGSVAGLNVGQVNQAGEEPNIQIRGRTSLSGEQNPLIVVDGVIYRGNVNDLNPNDIKSIDVLKDASAAAIYGSQASNGVIILTTKKGTDLGKPMITYSNSFTLQKPIKEFRTGIAEDYLRKTEESDLYNSRTEASGYLEPNPNWEPSTNFKTSDEILAYNQGRSDNWYEMMTNDNPFIQNHNLSLANATERSNYFISLGHTDQTGHLVNEGFKRINARVNLETNVTDWLTFGLQSSFSKSDYLGLTPSLGHRYLSPFATARDENGEFIQITGGNTINPLVQLESDFVDKRLSFFGNFYTQIDFPFLEGLSYKANYLNNYMTDHNYYFRDYASNFQGGGEKRHQFNYNWSSDHILTYKQNFNDVHNVFLTLLYGVESRESEYTRASSFIFANPALGYNNLQSGSADQQRAGSGGWDETSLYQMARLFYGYDHRYLFTGTVRRDGFSGFGTTNKFGLFPSLSFAWAASEETFISNNVDWLNNLKLRISYGSNGNRTVGRYQTLATVAGGFNYITADGTPVYTQAIDKLASPNLKWETTTGVNLGLDFAILGNRISGSIDYYDNETTDLLYQVDIPGISRFETFPDNLGRIHNHGLDVQITTANIRKQDLFWESTFVFSRNRNELRELLGFDLDGDGIEDDLVSEGLFIGYPLDAIFDYSINGLWQVNDEIPVYSDLGAYKVVDVNEDGTIDPGDRSIIGYTEPSFRFSINNTVSYKNWTVRFFINSIQGGSDRYLGQDNINSWQIINQENHFNNDFPMGMDYWTPENPDAIYERPNINISSGIAGTRYIPRSFVRLQDVSLAYNFPRELLDRANIQNLKLFVSGKNLITWTNWPGWDPETGQNINRTGRPVLKGYSLGLVLGF
jgi:TonB-linked SusC/RagA family outer membrane protein